MPVSAEAKQVYTIPQGADDEAFLVSSAI